MMIIKPIRITLFCLLFSPFLHAQVSTDGSLGLAIELQGARYLIGEDLGRQQGQNLFHSFSQFSLNAEESAHFQGNQGIEQVIVRVTGGDSSYIDGLLSSDMNADFFFLNPQGFRFGANAKLDISGDLSFSGANYICLDKANFYADLAANSTLSSAPVSAFGFADANQSQITFNGHGLLSAETGAQLAENKSTGMRLAADKNLNLIAQQIKSEQGSYYVAHGQDRNGKATETETLLPLVVLQNSGRLNVAAVASVGEAKLDNSGFDVSAFNHLGDIEITAQSAFHVEGLGVGNIHLQAEHIHVDNSELSLSTINFDPRQSGNIRLDANTVELNHSGQLASLNMGSAPGAAIRINARESISIKDTNANTKNKSSITALSFADGQVGDIELNAPTITVANADIEGAPFSSGEGGALNFIASEKVHLEKSNIAFSNFSREKGAGRGGKVLIQAPKIELASRTLINGGVFGTADAGDITLRGEQINISGDSRLFADAVFGSGNGGIIDIEADTIAVTEGSIIEASAKNFFGHGGQIKIKAKERLSLSGVGSNGEASAIKAGSQPFFQETIAGTGGSIDIQAGNLDLKQGASISNNSSAGENINSGDAGDIRIQVTGETLLSGANPHGENREGFGSGIYAQVLGVGNNTGKGGNIELSTGTLRIENGAVIKTSTNNQQAGGNIQLNVTSDALIQGQATPADVTEPPLSRQTLYIKEFVPSVYNQSVSGIYAETNNNADDAGRGGNIDIQAGSLTLLDQGQISTTTEGGGIAGNIDISAQQLYLDDHANIHSDSSFYNRFNFADASERDSKMLKLGDVVAVENDTDNAVQGYYVNVGDEMLRLNYHYQINELADLEALPTQYSFANGDMVRVNASGDYYIYNSSARESAFKWMLLDKQANPVELENLSELAALNNWTDGNSNSSPYPNGTALKVLDMGNGKPADFIYFVYPDSDTQFNMAQAVQIRQYFLTDASALGNLGDNQFLDKGDHAIILSSSGQISSDYIYNGKQWIETRDNHTVSDNTLRQNLVLSKQGARVHLETANDLGQDFIYDGKDWMPINPQPINVLNLAQRDALNAQEGDIAQVLNTGDERYDAFFYKDGQWQRQSRGGDAGRLDINISGRIKMGENTNISTESNSAGGGSIQLRAEQGYDLYRANISTSVQEGIGNSGNLNLDGNTFVALNQSRITAQADAGNGGNISLNTPYYLPSLQSLVSASSRLGIDGEVIINSPNNDVSSPLVALSSNFLNQPEIALNQCAIDALDALSRFNIKLEYNGKAKSPEDFQD